MCWGDFPGRDQEARQKNLGGFKRPVWIGHDQQREEWRHEDEVRKVARHFHAGPELIRVRF